MITLERPTQIEAPAPTAAAYNRPVGYLRATMVALVVAHHAALAYYPLELPPSKSLVDQPRLWEAFPVVDSSKWIGASLFVGFNDTFFMSLLFLLSGLFVWRGLARKGCATLLRDRLLRLGLPFVVAAAVFAPIAYYPSYLQTTGHAGIGKFWNEWRSLGNWPAGPAWFVWVLLAFDCVAALLFRFAPRWGETLGARTSRAYRRPAVLFAALIGISAIAYIPMALEFSPIDWAAFGPFTFQTSRLLHYLVYFLIGVGVGAGGLDRGLLAPDGRLSRRWPLWVVAALGLFLAATVVTLIGIASPAETQRWAIPMDAGFVLSCAATCFAFLAVFLRFVRAPSRLFDSLCANSYGIYLTHYAFVSWLQHGLLAAPLLGVAKAVLVFGGALALSWGVAATARRIPWVARVV